MHPTRGWSLLWVVCGLTHVVWFGVAYLMTGWGYAYGWVGDRCRISLITAWIPQRVSTRWGHRTSERESRGGVICGWWRRLAGFDIQFICWWLSQSPVISFNLLVTSVGNFAADKGTPYSPLTSTYHSLSRHSILELSQLPPNLATLLLNTQ